MSRNAGVVYHECRGAPFRNHLDVRTHCLVFPGVVMDASSLILAMIVVVLILVGAIILKKDPED